ncbi:MAG: RNA-binding protein [Pseudomonadota bacterium]
MKDGDLNDRTCIVTRTAHDRSALVRFVASPDGEVVADLKEKLPGRGVWVLAERDMVEQATKKNLFARGLKTSVRANQALASQVEMLLEKAALGSLGMARRAGACITGSSKISASIRGGKVRALLHAKEAADDGCRKLDQLLAVFDEWEQTGRNSPILRLFTSDQMNLALGGGNVIHAALTHGGAGESFLRHAEKLMKYRGLVPETNEH